MGAAGFSGYAGDVSPQICWDRLCEDSPAALVDVRTSAEWTFVGLPNLTETQSGSDPNVAGGLPFLVEWQVFPSMSANETFVEDLSAKLAQAGLSQDADLYFLCRSGVRSAHAAAAMSQAGFANCYNVAKGFEGDPDHDGHRGTQNGWKAAKLPWRQG